MNTNQFGFRSIHSTEHALISLKEKSRDSDEIVRGIVIGLHKTFDTVNHEILLAK